MLLHKAKIIVLISLLFGCSVNQSENNKPQSKADISLRNNYSISTASPAAEKYFQAVRKSSQNTIIEYDQSRLNDEAKEIISWMNKRLGKTIDPDPYILPHALSAAMRKMYLAAEQHEEKLGVKLYEPVNNSV